jgi:hypothetical protein
MNSKINKEWHESHKMPEKPSIDERITWHLDHVKHCKCRPIPEKLLEEIRKRGIAIPKGE